MHKVLIINYYWPPSGGPAVQRWLKLTQTMAQNGLKPVILTVDENHATYPFIDHSLLDEVPAEAEVYKTKTSEPLKFYKKYIGKGQVPASGFVNESNPNLLKKISRFIRGNFYIPDARKGWNSYAFSKAKELITEHSIRLVITAGPPHSTHLIGLKLKKKFNINWLADFHDYWTDISYYDQFYQLPFSKSIDKALEKKVLNKSDKIITHCRSSKRILLEKLNKQESEKISIITMAYDEALFDQPSNSPKDAFTITYTGTIADFYEPDVFFNALRNVKESFPEILIKLRIAGVIGQNVWSTISSLNLDENIEFLGYVERKKAVSYLLNSHVNLMINPMFKNEKYHVPGKLYEYLAARNPIINIAPIDGETAEIIKECNAGKTFERNMESQLTEYLKELAIKWNQNQKIKVDAAPDKIERYSYKNEGKKLVSLVSDMIN